MELFTIRLFAFIVFCLGSRLTFTLISAIAATWLLRIMGVIALFPVLGWFYFIFIGTRERGIEVFNEMIWWKDLRPLHMLLWSFFAYLALTGNHKAWVVLLLDSLIGLAAFLIHHYLNGNLKKIVQTNPALS